MKRLALSLAFILAGVSASAQLVQQASKEDLIEKLTPPAPPTTRSLRNLVPKPVNVDLSINFDFDSDRLQASSKPLLDNLAQAMNSERLGALLWLGASGAGGGARAPKTTKEVLGFTRIY